MKKCERRLQHSTRLDKGDLLLCAVVFFICFAGACILPIERCPDEWARQLLTDFIVKNGTLPIGNEPEVIIKSYGFSYALRPYLSSIISAFFGKAMMLVTVSPAVLRPMFRMGSVLSTVFTAVYSLKIGKIIFKTTWFTRLFASIIVFLPQVLFLGMYLNNDSLSLMAVMLIIYYYVLGRKTSWNITACVGLGVGFSVALLSYYTIYGWILLAGVFFFISLIKEKKETSFVVKRVLIVVGICIALAGWFFIRNMILHNGDIFGLITEARILDSLKRQGVDPLPYYSFYENGYSFLSFITYRRLLFVKLTVNSFIGCFGNMEFPLPKWVYIVYCMYYGFGFVMYFIRRFRNKESEYHCDLFWMMAWSSLFTICFHVYQSYFRDFQAQGRYIISLVLFLSFMITCGIEFFSELQSNKEDDKSKTISVFFSVFYILMAGFSILSTMPKMLI